MVECATEHVRPVVHGSDCTALDWIASASSASPSSAVHVLMQQVHAYLSSMACHVTCSLTLCCVCLVNMHVVSRGERESAPAAR
jgi:hypothetical protein